MALDRLGNTIVAGAIYALAGTVRHITGDSIVLLLGVDKEKAIRCKAGDIVRVDDTTSGGGGPTAHSTLTGLSADDHPQYVLANGTRAFSAVVAGVDPTLSAHLSTKAYVDYADTVLSGTILAAAVAAFQPLNAVLTNLATFTTSVSGNVPYFANTIGGLTSAASTSFGRGLWNVADAAAARSAIGAVIGTNVQAWAAKLDTLVALTWAADTLGYFTGAGTMATVSFPSFGRSLVASASKAAAKTTLGLEIGVDVQQWDAKLDALAGLTWANDKGVLFTGTSTVSTFTLTSAARTVLDDTTVAAMVDTLGGASSTGTGGLVRATSPTLVTPALGTPTALVLTNATGLVTAGINANQVTNAKLAQMANATVKGRNTAGTGDPEDVTLAQLRALLACPYVLASEGNDPVRTIGATSVAEHDLCSLTVPANTLGTTGKCVLELVGEFLNNSSSTNTYRMKVKFGSTTAYNKASAFVTATQPRPFVMRVHLCAKGSNSKQRVTTEILHGYLLTATTGYGDWGEFNGRSFVVQGDTTEVSTSDLALTVTIQNDVNHASTYFRLYSAKLIAYP